MQPGSDLDYGAGLWVGPLAGDRHLRNYTALNPSPTAVHACIESTYDQDEPGPAKSCLMPVHTPGARGPMTGGG